MTDIVNEEDLPEWEVRISPGFVNVYKVRAKDSDEAEEKAEAIFNANPTPDDPSSMDLNTESEPWVD